LWDGGVTQLDFQLAEFFQWSVAVQVEQLKWRINKCLKSKTDLKVYSQVHVEEADICMFT
jgi:hypothetical protein